MIQMYVRQGCNWKAKLGMLLTQVWKTKKKGNESLQRKEKMLACFVIEVT